MAKTRDGENAGQYPQTLTRSLAHDRPAMGIGQGSIRPPAAGAGDAYQERFAWTQDSNGNNYISSTLTAADPGQSDEAQKRSGQIVDGQGNPTGPIYSRQVTADLESSFT